jgi:PPP family 3-phenylpropionic acid transporter
MGVMGFARKPLPDGALRMAAVYATALAGTGVSTPFISLWFAAHGLNGAEISAVLAAPMLARLVTSPLVAVWADGLKLRRTALAVLAGVAALGYLALAFGGGVALWLPAWFVAATAIASFTPLADVLALKRARSEGFAFGLPRGVGSLSYLIANVAMGALLAHLATGVVLVWIVAAGALAAVTAAVVAPLDPVHLGGTPQGAARFAGLGRLVSDPVFMTAIVAVGLIQASHAFYYAFSTLVWRAQGTPEAMWGLLWATGVAAEIGFLWFLEPWRRRVGPWVLLMLGGAGAVVRWTAFAFAPPLWLLWPLQVLHALSFAASFYAGLQIVERLSPPESQSAAQTLNGALSSGVLIGLATVLSGPLFDRYGALGYLAMSVLAALGLIAGFTLRPVLRDVR